MTAEWLSEVLGAEVGRVEQQRIGDGLVGMNLRLRVLDSDPSLPSSVVVKLPSPDPTSRATGLTMRTYEREVRFYRDIAPTVDIRMPRCHHAEWDPPTGDFALVLEDISPAEPGDQIAGCTIERARCVVAELGKLHGPRWDDPTLADVDWLNRHTGPDDSAQLKALWDWVFPGFVQTYAPYLSSEGVALVERFGGAIVDWVEGRSGPRAVTHGDFRLDNLLFGTAEGGSPVTVVDWQTPGHAPPISDVSYFLGAGPLPPDRAEHESSLLSTYGESLAAYGIDLDEGWAWDQYRREAFSGVIMAVIASQVVGRNDRSEAMFAAMATRHLQHALDLDALALV